MRRIMKSSAQRARCALYVTAVLPRSDGGMSPETTPAASSARRFDLTVCSLRFSRTESMGMDAGPLACKSLMICTRAAEPNASIANWRSTGRPVSILRGMNPS